MLLTILRSIDQRIGEELVQPDAIELSSHVARGAETKIRGRIGGICVLDGILTNHVDVNLLKRDRHTSAEVCSDIANQIADRGDIQFSAQKP